MNKSLLAVALLGVLGVASAESNVKVYGVVDAGLTYANGAYSAGSLFQLESGVQSGSRLGFKGTEDLGNGLKALFVLEQGFDLTTGVSGQGGRLFGREALIGLEGNFGAVKAGRQYTPIFSAYDSIDPFGTGTAGDMTGLFGQDADFVSRDIRMDNSITYATPSNLGGLYAKAAYAFGGEAGDTSANRQMGLSAGYLNGPAHVVYAYHNANDLLSDIIPGDYRTHFVGGTYDFKAVKLHAALDRTTRGSAYKMQSYLIGASMPLGLHSVYASYNYRNDKVTNNANSSQFAIGYSHTLTKRTNLYSALAYTKNDQNSTVYTDVPGNSVKRIQAGIRHIF